MKKIYFLFISLFWVAFQGYSQSFCPNNMLVNADFSAGLTGWSQYGTVPTATVLPIVSGCINNSLVLQATTNSNVGVSQPALFRQDSCYSLCYCVEFPGGSFNAKLTIAAITPGVTVTQLLTGSFTPAQAQIIDVISATNGFSAYTQCTGSFQAAAAYTDLVIVNETIGPYGSDVRVDDVCLIPDVCPPSCGNVNAAFTYTTGPGLLVSFADLSTSNPGDLLMWNWDFGDPPSGINNTSTLQNPTHTYPAPGYYLVCLYLTAILNNGLACHDTLCMDVLVDPATGIQEAIQFGFRISPNPAKDVIQLDAEGSIGEVFLSNGYGSIIAGSRLQGGLLRLPEDLAPGVYMIAAKIDGTWVHRKLMILD